MAYINRQAIKRQKVGVGVRADNEPSAVSDHLWDTDLRNSNNIMPDASQKASRSRVDVLVQQESHVGTGVM